MMIPLDEVFHFRRATHDATGQVVAADSTPTYSVFEEATDTEILEDVSMTATSGETGVYRGAVTLSAANGFEVGKWYSLLMTAVVDGITAIETILEFRIAPAETVAGVPLVTLNNEARGEPAQGAPGVSIGPLTKLDYLYKAWRNRKTNDGTETKFFADDGTTVDHKQTTAESSGTVSKGEIVSGP